MKIDVGNISIEAFMESKFALDGGAMFGVVPKALWDKKTQSDELNRITLAANIVFIKHPKYNLMIEQGLGDKWNEKQREIYKIRQKKSQTDFLNERGFKPDDITHVIFTHLHFDHSGGATVRNSTGDIVPLFPNAKYFVQREQFDEASNPHERNSASFLPETFMPIYESGQMELLDGNGEILPGIKVVVTGGHARGHQVVEIDFDDFKAVYIGDLIPTAHHMQLAYIMGYDLFPNDTLEFRKKLLPRYVAEQRLIIFPHEDRFFAGVPQYDEAKNRYLISKTLD
jgi:glyoxylase-like metal-dependent hydrolase (beta-lactamase superfamily II)